MPQCKKKKILRLEKKLAKNPNYVIKTPVLQQKSLEDFISENDLVSADEVKNFRVRIFIILRDSIFFLCILILDNACFFL